MKKCKICNKTKNIKSFSQCYHKKNKKYYTFSYCKKCNKEKSIQWGKDNIEKNRAKANKYWWKTHKKINK